MLAAVHTMLGTDLSLLLGCLALFLAGTVAGQAMATDAPAPRKQKDAQGNPPVGATGSVTKWKCFHPRHLVTRKFPPALQGSNTERVKCTIVGAGDLNVNGRHTAV